MIDKTVNNDFSKTTDFTNIYCVADTHITTAIDQCLSDLAVPEVFVQRSKQLSLIDKPGFLGLRPVTKLDESRALIYRMYVPSEYGKGLMDRIAEAADLKMGGRGCIFALPVTLERGTPLSFDTEKFERICGPADKSLLKDHVLSKDHVLPKDHILITCTVPRGVGDMLAQAVLELGVCVPVVFFGSGMGFRDKLGLLRITIPIEKEVIWFLVPRSDAELVEKTLILRARLDKPGNGFIYKNFVHAPVVNLRIRQGKRVHAATMEQVIAALDEVRGSSDWRRLGLRKAQKGSAESKNIHARALFFIGREEEVEIFRRTAMENGARGATLNSLEMRSYSGYAGEHGRESHGRELCDIIISPDVEKKVLEAVSRTGVFGKESSCVLKVFDAEMSPGIRSFSGKKKA